MVDQSKTFIQEFVNFVKGFGVIGLALGVVIGGAVNELAASLSSHIISPILVRLFNVKGLEGFQWEGIQFGLFLASLINFVILVFVIYIAVKLIIGRMLTKDEREKLGL